MKSFRLKIIAVFAVVAVVIVLTAVLLLRPRPTSQEAESSQIGDRQPAEPVVEPEPNDPAYLALKEKAEGPRQEIAESYSGSAAAERADAVLSELPNRYQTRTDRQQDTQAQTPSRVSLEDVRLSEPREDDLPPGLPDYIYERYGLRGPAATSVSPGVQSDKISAEMLQKLPERYRQLLTDETGRINLDHIRKLSEEQRADSAVPPDTEQGRYHSADANEPPSRR